MDYTLVVYLSLVITLTSTNVYKMECCDTLHGGIHMY